MKANFILNTFYSPFNLLGLHSELFASAESEVRELADAKLSEGVDSLIGAPAEGFLLNPPSLSPLGTELYI